VQVAANSNAAVRGQLRGMVPLAVVWLAMAIGFRSIRLGLPGLVPNVLPCLLTHGSLATLDRPLSVASATIGTTRELGLLAASTIQIALAADLIVMLALLMLPARSRANA